jgi:hypothetical protein
MPALKIGLERRFDFDENGGISEDMAFIAGRTECFAPEYSEESDHFHSRCDGHAPTLALI